MLASPWDIVLTLAFTFTGLVCILDLVRRDLRTGTEAGTLSDTDVVDVTHAVMSGAMILMIWVTVWDAVTWAQMILFAIFALALLPTFGRTRGLPGRVDLVGHIGLDAAMIWMLAAMPLLMAGAGTAGSGSVAGHEGHGGGTTGPALAATPGWADVVNAGFVVLCAAALVWWLYRFVTVRAHRLHRFCHLVMAAGMGTMLLLMNG